MARSSVSSRIAKATTTRRAMLGATGVGVVALGLGQRPSPALSQATPAAVPPAVERWAAAWNAHDPAAMAALFTDDGLDEDLAFGASFRGKEGVAEWVTITSSIISDTAVEVVGAYQAGDRATAEWIFTGSSLIGADGAVAPAPGRPFSVRVASVFELEGDLIRRVSDYYNPTTLQNQPGPPDGEAAATPTA